MQQHIKNLWAHKNSKYFRVGLFAYTVLLFVATLSPMDYLSVGDSGWSSYFKFPHMDKLVHFFMFFFLTIILFLSYKLRNIYYFLIPFFIGILIEILQYTFPTGRSFEVWDIVADTLGALVAFFLLPKLRFNA